MNMSKSQDISKPKCITRGGYIETTSQSPCLQNAEECRDNDENSQSVFLSFKCILACNCEGTEQLQIILIRRKRELKWHLSIRQPAPERRQETILRRLW